MPNLHEKKIKGQLRATILKSAEIVNLIFLCYFDDAIRCAVSADLKIAIWSLVIAH